MEEKKRPSAVAAAFIRDKGKYLVVLDCNFNFWRVPGGRVEFGERIEDTVKREMKEELNLVVRVERCVGFGQDTPLLHGEKRVARMINFFECTIAGGELKLDPEEATECKWLVLKEIPALSPLEPALKDFFSRKEGRAFLEGK